MAVVMFVLVIAGANVANLLLLRSAARAREMALRTAMGATRWRLVRQLLLESVVLSLAGAALGIVLAQGAVQAFARGDAERRVAVLGRVLDRLRRARLRRRDRGGDGDACSAWRRRCMSRRTNSNDVIKDGGRGSIGAPRVRRFGAAMVVLELSVAIALLGGAGLLVRSFAALYSIDLGVNIDPLVTMSVDLPASKYPTADDRRAFVAALEPRLAAIPGVQAATITTGVPSRDGGERYLEIEGTPSDAPRVMVSTVTITPSFFDTIDVRMRQRPRLRGRRWRTGIRNGDRQRAARRAVSSRTGSDRPARCASRRRQPAPGDPPDVVANHRRRRARCQPRIAVGQLPQRRRLPALSRSGAGRRRRCWSEAGSRPRRS